MEGIQHRPCISRHEMVAYNVLAGGVSNLPAELVLDPLILVVVILDLVFGDRVIVLIHNLAKPVSM